MKGYIDANKRQPRWFSRLVTALFPLLFCAYSGWPQQVEGQVVGNPHRLEPVRGSFNPLRYSEGYMFGMITEAADSGIFIHTLEGQLRLGMTSSSGGMLDKTCYDSEIQKAPADKSSDEYRLFESNIVHGCTIAVNPWVFSNLNQDLVLPLSNLKDTYSIVFYRSYFWIPFVSSRNYLLKVYPVNPDILPVGASYSISGATVESLLHYSSGFVEGRFVKASLDNVIRKSYDAIIQLSNSGNIFQEFSIDDDRLFDFVIHAMASGRYLRVSYYRLIGPVGEAVNLLRGYKTLYRIYRVEVIEQPSEGAAPNESAPR